MSRFFTSDNHFWHQNILKYCPLRPWKTVEEMNEGMVQNWNAVVSPEDEVYHIGDFAMAFRPVELYTRRLNGIKHLITGNHDFCSPIHKKSKTPDKWHEWTQKYLDNGWATVAQVDAVMLGDQIKFRMAHLPYIETSSYEDQRHAKWREEDDGTPLLCGHVHSHWITRRTDKGTLMVNVGIDMNPRFEPWSEAQLCEIINESMKPKDIANKA